MNISQCMAIALTILFTQLDAAAVAPYQLSRDNKKVILYNPATKQKNTIFQLDAASYTSRCAAAGLMKKGAENAVIVLIERLPGHKEVILMDLQGKQQSLISFACEKIGQKNSLSANEYGDKILVSSRVSAALCDLEQQKASVYHGENIVSARFIDNEQAVVMDNDTEVMLTFSK